MQIHHDTCENISLLVEKKSIDLIVSSPPYGIGKNYEKWTTEDDYRKWAECIVKSLCVSLKEGGAICWQVGNWTSKDGTIIPLDCIYIELFKKYGMHVKNRIIWKYNSGLHNTNRLSGRYEMVLWMVKDPKSYCFNLDTIRIPSDYPGKTAYKGSGKGELSGNYLGKNPTDVWEIMMQEWEEGIWDLPNVKNGHPEKESHPCQYPIELAERCILAFSNKGDVVLDPFVGSGSTMIAAQTHGRKGIGIDSCKEYVALTQKRLKEANDCKLKRRYIGTAITKDGGKRSQYPKEWLEALSHEVKKPRLAITSNQSLYEKECKQ